MNLPNIKLMNMCMIVDEVNNRVIVQDRIKKDWEGITFPGGKIENGESVIESTIREVKEETGLDVSDLKHCGLIDWYNDSNHERWFIFLYKSNKFSGELLKETHEGKVYWVDVNQLKNMDLASGMEEYLKLFFDDNYGEVFAVWNDNYTGKLRLI